MFVGSFFKGFILEAHSFPKKVKTLHKKNWARAKKIVVLTSFLKTKLMEENISQDKILVASDGVDLEKFNLRISKKEAREKLNIPLDKKIILFVGSELEWKGVDILKEASNFLPDGTEVFLIGKIKKEEKFEKIVYVGFKQNSEIPIYLKAADALILPNKKGQDISEKYTSPLKLFEYMASGRPIIASDLPSLREVLDENNSIFFEPNNSKDLADKIEKVFQNPESADRISARALSDVKKYTWRNRANNILNFIKK